jgi:hypothetical protein
VGFFIGKSQMSNPLFPPLCRLFNGSGDPLNGGKVYTYEAGTLAPKTTWTDSTMGTENANPVILDSEGYPTTGGIWGEGFYKIIIEDANGVQQGDPIDNYTNDSGEPGAAGTFQMATAGGTVDAITATYSPVVTLSNLTTVGFVSLGSNTTTTPTFSPDGLAAKTITKRGGSALVAGDIGPALSVHILEYNSANTRWELLNPATATVMKAGTIDAVVIGGTTPSTGVFSALGITAASPIFTINDTNAGANATLTKMYTSSGGRFEMATFTDADAVNTIFYQTVRSGATITGINHTVDSGSHNFLGGVIVGVPTFPTAEALTVASGVITVGTAKNVATINGEGAAADNLDTINGGVARGIYRFSAGSSSQDITFKHGTGNILLSGNQDWTTLTTNDSILFYFDGSNYRELSRFYSGASSPVNRGFIKFNGSGTPAITSSYNVTSITDHGTGDYSLNHTIAMPSANYCVTGIAKAASASVTANVAIDSANAPTTSACRIGVHNDAGTKVDATDIHITFIGG